LRLERVATRDRRAEQDARQKSGRSSPQWILTFDPLLRNTEIVEDLRNMARVVRDGYGTEVDIEFTANMMGDGSYSIDIVQCRPFHGSAGAEEPLGPIPKVSEDQVVLRTFGGVIGPGRRIKIDRIIYVSPEAYTGLPEAKRYALARLIGKVTKHTGVPAETLMMIGPGRWGSSTPSLGIPVSFNEISNVSVLVEVDALHEGLVPDLSLGTHFFNDMVEMNMLYLAHFLAGPRNRLNRGFLEEAPSTLSRLVDDASEWEDVVRVIDAVNGEIVLQADALEQACLVYTSP